MSTSSSCPHFVKQAAPLRQCSVKFGKVSRRVFLQILHTMATPGEGLQQEPTPPMR